jgi:hypothetical protein
VDVKSKTASRYSKLVGELQKHLQVRDTVEIMSQKL